MNSRPALIILLILCCLSGWSQDKPKKPYQLFEEAERVYFDGNFSKALELLDECLKADPAYLEAYQLRGGAREQLNDLAGALTDYSIFLEKLPDHPDVLVSRGILRYRIGYYQQAREDLLRALNLSSNETTSIFYKQNMSVDERRPMMTTTQSGHNPYVLNYLGLIEHKLNNPKGAIEYFDAAIRLESKEPDFYVNKGLAKEQLNDSTAIIEYGIALRINPNHTLAKHNMEALKAKKVQLLSPEERLSRTIEADSTMLYPYLERAQQRFEAKYYEGALDDYNQALELDQSNAEIYFARGLTREKLKDLDGAFSDYTKAIDLQENLTKAWLSRGNVLLKLERYNDAIDDYNVALVHQEDYALAYYNRGMAKAKLKKESEACADLQKAESLGMKVDAKIKGKVCD